MSIWTGLNYKETFILNSIRVLFSGAVMFIIALVGGAFQDQFQESFLGGLAMIPIMLLAFPLFILFWYWVLLPVYLFLVPLSDVWWGFGLPLLIFWMLGVFVVAGDPIYFVAARIFKKLPISPDFGPLNLTLFLRVIRDDSQIVHNVE